MSGTIVTKYVCDLCAKPAEEKGQVALPLGWVKVVIESRFVERDFTDKHVCKSCVGEIVMMAKK
jgi:hypothetical protein